MHIISKLRKDRVNGYSEISCQPHIQSGFLPNHLFASTHANVSPHIKSPRCSQTKSFIAFSPGKERGYIYIHTVYNNKLINNNNNIYIYTSPLLSFPFFFSLLAFSNRYCSIPAAPIGCLRGI